jgi:hypothetical protein
MRRRAEQFAEARLLAGVEQFATEVGHLRGMPGAGCLEVAVELGGFVGSRSEGRWDGRSGSRSEGR